MKKSHLTISPQMRRVLLWTTAGHLSLTALLTFGQQTAPGVSNDPLTGLLCLLATDVPCRAVIGLLAAGCGLAVANVLRRALRADDAHASMAVLLLMAVGAVAAVIDAAATLTGAAIPLTLSVQAAQAAANFSANNLLVTSALTLWLAAALATGYRGWLRLAGVLMAVAPAVGWGIALMMPADGLRWLLVTAVPLLALLPCLRSSDPDDD